MGEMDLANASVSDSSQFKDFSVSSETIDSPDGIREWHDDRWTEYLGYYKDEKTPEITAIIDTGSAWTIGRGYKADEETTMLLDSIKGNGYDTTNSIIENADRVMSIGGNSYAEIIRDDEENLINLKPLDPGSMKHDFDKSGMFVGFTQQTRNKEGKITFERKLRINQVFYLPRNRIADEMHGNGIIRKLKLILDMKNEAMADNRLINHRYAYPRWIIHLDTDDETKIAGFKAKYDKANANGENLYVPKDVVVPELMAVATNATINLLPWINYLDGLFYQVGKVPKIVVGGSSEFTEKASAIVYLAFQQNIEARQLYIEEQFLAQLNLVIELNFPVSLENELLTDEKKDQEPTTVQPNETTAGQEGE